MCFSYVAAYSFTAIDTRPKEIAPFQIDLMLNLSCRMVVRTRVLIRA